MLDCLNRLDGASYCLTRVAAFADRSAPDSEDLGVWLEERDPAWRKDGRDPDSLGPLGPGAYDQLPYALDNLITASRDILKLSTTGWKFTGGGPVTTVARWRLPVGTLHAAAAAAGGRNQVGPPPTTVSDSDFDRALSREGAIDGHVHIGTCLPFDALFELLQVRARMSPEAFAEVVRADDDFELEDSMNVPFRPAHTVATAAILASILDAYLAAGSNDFAKFVTALPHSNGFKQALLDGRSWEFLSEVDESQPGGSLRFNTGFQLLADETGQPAELPADPYRSTTERKLALLRKALEEDATPGYLACIEDLFRCEALVHCALTQGNQTGLSEFLAISNRLSELRAPLPSQSRLVVRHGLPHLARGAWLRGVELRTAEQFAAHTGPGNLARSIDAKLAGYEDALRDISDRAPVVTWPICLIKTHDFVDPPDHPVSTAKGHTRFSLGPLFELVAHTAELLSIFPLARRVVPGLDIAGDENAVPSWCFALLFQEFQERISQAEPVENQPGALSFRVHAGEDFHSPLQGLRRIYEAVRWVVPEGFTPRIGHALALSDSMAQQISAEPSKEPRDEAFDDLVWAWSLLDQDPRGGNRQLVELLAEAIEEMGFKLYEVDDATPSDYFQAYRKRFDRTALRNVGFLVESVQGGQAALADAIRSPSPRIEDRILFRYLTDPGLAAPQGGQGLDPAWMTQVIDAVRQPVRELLRARNAVIESCPTSNLIIGGIDDYRRHPIHEWIREGLGVTINTDDPGLFSINLQDEYANVWSSSDQGQRSTLLQEVREGSLDMIDSYATPEEAEKVVKTLRAEFAQAGWSSN